MGARLFVLMARGGRPTGRPRNRHPPTLVYYNCSKATSGKAWPDIPNRMPCGGVKIAYSSHLVGQRADLLDPNLDHVAGLEEFPARRADAGRRAGENEIARMQRHPARQLRDLLGQIEDHALAVGVLFQHVVDPQLEAEILRIADIARRHDPWAERTGAVEGLVLGPIGFERRGVADVRAPATIARGEVI